MRLSFKAGLVPVQVGKLRQEAEILIEYRRANSPISLFDFLRCGIRFDTQSIIELRFFNHGGYAR